MKYFFTLLFVIGAVLGTNAQYIYNDFDGNQNVTFLGWPNLPTIIANPDPSGANTSANVAEWARSQEQWANFYAELDGKIDFSTGDFFYVKVWSPIACEVLFKLEDKANSNIFIQESYDLTTPNQWVDITFDFTGSTAGVYDKIVIFLDFATTTDNTYYIDDIEGPEFGAGPGPKPYLALDVQDNFENDGWATIETWKFQDPDLLDLTISIDPVNASNNVADYNRSGSFEWTNAQTVLNHRMDLTSRNTFEMDVYFPSSNTYGDDLTPTAAIKLQNSLLGPNAYTTQTEIKLDVNNFDEWVTLSYDFSVAADSVNYDQIVVQLGGEGHFVPAQFYFDNLELQGVTGIGDAPVTKSISVYPNPAADFILLEDIVNFESINIYNAGGQSVYSNEIRENKIDVSGLEKGLYIINILTNEGEIISSKFVKK
jgi:hypothetical protein